MRPIRRAPTTIISVASFCLVSGSCARPDAQPPSVSLVYEATLVERGFPNPAARVTFNGRTAWFLFDTGAGVHTLARWFVDAAGLPLDDSLANTVRGVDAAGERVKFEAVRSANGALPDGTDLRLGVAVVADFPPMFETEEVGGLINPQLLSGAGRASVLDLRVPDLRFEAFEDAVGRLGAREVPRDSLRICGSLDSPVPNLLYAVAVSSATGEGMLGLDSGAGETLVTVGAPLIEGVSLEAGGEAMGVAGKGRPYRLARGLRIAFAGHEVTVDAQVVDRPGDECGPVGRLGLDAMGGCAFVMGEDRLAIACG